MIYKSKKATRDGRSYFFRIKYRDVLGVQHDYASKKYLTKKEATLDSAVDVARYFDVSLAELIGTDLKLDNAELIDTVFNGRIPILGSIKAGIPIEAQEDICGYIDIPKEWCKGGKKYFALKISGDSMETKYQDGDIVVIEQTTDVAKINNKDCVVMVNPSDATFKHITITDDGIVLAPLNTSKYQLKFYTKDQVVSLPVVVLGVAIEKRTRL